MTHSRILCRHLLRDPVQVEHLHEQTSASQVIHFIPTFDVTTFLEGLPNSIIRGVEWKIANENTSLIIVLCNTNLTLRIRPSPSLHLPSHLRCDLGPYRHVSDVLCIDDRF